MYYSNVYSGAIYYGNNDYRDYIAHSRGPWKEHLYKFIDAAGRYVYDTAKKVGSAVGNATGYTAKRQMQNYIKGGQKATSAAAYYRKKGDETSAKTYTKAAAERFRTAREYGDKYRKSLAGAIDRTGERINEAGRKISLATQPIREAAKAGYRTAKNAVIGAYNKLKSSKFGRAISGLIEKGKQHVRIFLANNPILQKMRANKVTKQFNADQDKMNAEYKRKKKRTGLANTHKDKRYRTGSRGITPLGRASSGSASYIMKNH